MDDEQHPDWHVRAGELVDALPGDPMGRYPEGVPFVQVLQRGSMSLELFEPRGEDRQQPHTQDELYLVLAGTSGFVRGQERITCAPGDAIFVPAGMAHRFVGMSAGFRTWVVLYGPSGGERR